MAGESSAAQMCELGGCKFLPLCEWCEQAEIIAATKHLRDPSVYSPLAARWGMAGQLPPPEIEAYIEQVLADVSGGSSSSLTPGAGDATQGTKDAEPMSERKQRIIYVAPDGRGRWREIRPDEASSSGDE